IRWVQPDDVGQMVLYSFFFCSAIFLSSWYFTGVTNALRHAMSLSVLYLALSYLRDRQLILFFVLFVVAALFHKTTALVFPFVVLSIFSFFSLRVATICMLLIGFGYF